MGQMEMSSRGLSRGCAGVVLHEGKAFFFLQFNTSSWEADPGAWQQGQMVKKG